MTLLACAVDLVLPARDTARLVRETSEEAFLELLDPRLTPHGITALLPYRHPLVRAVIVEAKFNHSPKATTLLGRALAVYLTSRAEERSAWQEDRPVLIPIPLSKERQQERGYNQTERIGVAAGQVVVRALVRTRNTPPQTSLTRTARLTNLIDAFAREKLLPADRTYIVFDDVTTTGATLIAAKETLSSGSPLSLELLALAH